MTGLKVDFKGKFMIVTDEITGEELITEDPEKTMSVISSWLNGGTPIGGHKPNNDGTLKITPRGNSIILSRGSKSTETKNLDIAIGKIRAYINGGAPL